MMWFDKNNPEVVFMDKRSGFFKASNGIVAEVIPDVKACFTNLPFESASFKLVVFDPPHRSDLTEDNWMAIQYGKLFAGWEEMIRAGFSECMRVLEPGGVLIFKWNEKQIKLKRIMPLLPQKPLFGHTSGKHTIWMTFIKGEGASAQTGS